MTPVYGFSIAAGIDWCITSGREKGVGITQTLRLVGGGRSHQKFFWLFGQQFGLKIRALPWICHCLLATEIWVKLYAFESF